MKKINISILFAALEKKMEKWKDEILTKEDKVITMLVKSEPEVLKNWR